MKYFFLFLLFLALVFSESLSAQDNTTTNTPGLELGFKGGLMAFRGRVHAVGTNFGSDITYQTRSLIAFRIQVSTASYSNGKMTEGESGLKRNSQNRWLTTEVIDVTGNLGIGLRKTIRGTRFSVFTLAGLEEIVQQEMILTGGQHGKASRSLTLGGSLGIERPLGSSFVGLELWGNGLVGDNPGDSVVSLSKGGNRFAREHLALQAGVNLTLRF